MTNNSEIYHTSTAVEKSQHILDAPSNGSNSIDIGEIIETPDATLMSTSAVLYYCKSRILYPYIKFLAFMGLRPASLDQLHASKFCAILSHYHTFQVAVVICLGYTLQYMSCFRRDAGFLNMNGTYPLTNLTENLCEDTLIFSHVIPSVLHFSGYLYAIYLFRISDNEYLQNLMEKVFLLSSFPPQNTPHASPKKLLKTLWIYIIFGFVWMMLSLSLLVAAVLLNKVTFQWIDEEAKTVIRLLEILLVLGTFTHDAVQATILIHYCLQAQLLTAHLEFLHERLLTRTISPLDWMKELSEFKRLLGHLNGVLAPAAAPLLLADVCWIISAGVSYARADSVGVLRYPNCLLWILAAAAPFVSAARLSAACRAARGVGHDVVARPFLHRDTPQEDLDAVLLYASSLRLSAEMFKMPIEGRHLCLVLVLAALATAVAGMRHKF